MIPAAMASRATASASLLAAASVATLAVCTGAVRGDIRSCLGAAARIERSGDVVVENGVASVASFGPGTSLGNITCAGEAAWGTREYCCECGSLQRRVYRPSQATAPVEGLAAEKGLLTCRCAEGHRWDNTAGACAHIPIRVGQRVRIVG